MDVFYEIVAGRYLKIMRRAASAQSILLRCLPRRYQYRPVARTAGDLPSNNEGSASRSRRIRGKKGKKEKQFSPHITPPSPYPLRTCTSKQWWGSRVVVVVVVGEAKAKSLPGQVKGKERNVGVCQRIEARSSSGSSRLFSQDISDALSGLRGARGMEVRGSGSGPGFGGGVCDVHRKEGLCEFHK